MGPPAVEGGNPDTGSRYNDAVSRSWLIIGGLALLAGAAAVRAAEVIRPEEVAPGTRGVCVTEMDGGERVESPVTVLGTLGPAAPEAEMVLVRLEDPRFAETGIIAGMSGSPVYVDGRLLGALAFGWAFERRPIGGVTPFVRMQAMARGTASGPPGGRPALGELSAAWLGEHPGAPVLDWLLPEAAVGGAAPLPLAVTVGSGPAACTGWLGTAWRRLGWVAAPAAAGRTAKSPRDDLRPGDMVAGILVSGDATLAVGGTVTEVRGSRVWAFGHPFLGGGRYAMPLARGHVLAVLPSSYSSFKFFTTGEVLGAFTEDRARGVLGELGAAAPTVPVRVTANGRTYRFRALRHRVLLPLLGAYLAASSLQAHGKTFGDQTLRTTIDLGWADGSSLELGETFSQQDAPGRAAALVSALLAYVEASPFEPPELARIEVRLEQVERVRRMELMRVVPGRRTVHPGDELDVRLWLHSHGEGVVERCVRLEVPAWASRGRLDLVVADGASWSQYDLRTWPLEPRSFGDELRLLRRLRPSTEIVAVLEARESGLALPGGTVAVPPSHALSLAATLGTSAGQVRRLPVARAVERMPWPVSGAVRIPLRVDGRPPAGQGGSKR